MSKVIFHVPHDGNDFPKELLDSIIIPYDEFLKQHNHISDKYVSNLIPEGYEVIKFPISRLLCDVERFLDDSEPMLKFGMGFCYEYVYDGTKIKNINQDILDKTLKHYNKHHKLLNDAVAPNEDVFIIDLHSFERDLIIKETLSSNTDRYPDFCIGYDKGFCSEETMLKVVEIISNHGYSVSINYPFKGSIVPNKVLKSPKKFNCQSMMIEVNKELYLDNGDLGKQAEKIKQVILEIATACGFKRNKL